MAFKTPATPTAANPLTTPPNANESGNVNPDIKKGRSKKGKNIEATEKAAAKITNKPKAI